MSSMAFGALELVAVMAIYTVFSTAEALGIPRDQLPVGLTQHIGAGRSERNATPATLCLPPQRTAAGVSCASAWPPALPSVARSAQPSRRRTAYMQ